MRKKIFGVLILMLVSFPLLALAQNEFDSDFEIDYPSSACSQKIQSFKQLVACGVDAVVNPLIYLIGAIALLVFLWGVFNYIREAGNDGKRAEASKMILFGIIGLFVMVSVWGLVNILVGTFPLSREVPQIQFPTS